MMWGSGISCYGSIRVLYVMRFMKERKHLEVVC